MKINLKRKSLSIAKAQLKNAENSYVQLLEASIKNQLDPDNLVDAIQFKKALQTKTGLVSEYIMNMGVWSIQEQFIKEYHRLEKLIYLLNTTPSHQSECEGLDEESELEIIDRKSVV